jgi:hypothetical protein
MATPTIDTFTSQIPMAPPDMHMGLSAASAPVQDVYDHTLDLRAIPDPLWFAPTIDARLKIVKPFRVVVARDGENVTATAEEIDEFGYGLNAGDALSDLGKTIAELYLSLEGALVVSGELARVRAVLETHIVRVHP